MRCGGAVVVAAVAVVQGPMHVSAPSGPFGCRKCMVHVAGGGVLEFVLWPRLNKLCMHAPGVLDVVWRRRCCPPTRRR